MFDENSKYVVNLIESAKKGNQKAFLQLVEMYHNSLFALCFRFLGNEQSALEMTEFVLNFAKNNIQQVRMNSSFFSWLHGIAIYQLLEILRKEIAAYTISDKKIENTPKNYSIHLSHFDLLLQNLPFDERVVLILHDIKKYSYAEIKDLLGDTTEMEVRIKTSIARRKLMAGLKK